MSDLVLAYQQSHAVFYVTALDARRRSARTRWVSLNAPVREWLHRLGRTPTTVVE